MLAKIRVEKTPGGYVDMFVQCPDQYCAGVITYEDVVMDPRIRQVDPENLLCTSIRLSLYGGWTGADWTHEYDVDEFGEVTYCTGDKPDCGTCENARADAEESEAEGEEAMISALHGDFTSAAKLLKSAADRELSYGDATVWGPVAVLADSICAAEAEFRKRLEDVDADADADADAESQ